MKRVYILIFAMIFGLELWAVPATPNPIQITLADGSTTEVFLRGDEFAHHYTLLDGTPVRLEQGKLIPDYILPEITRQKMHVARQADVQASGFPNTGSPRGLVFLVNFADKKFIKTNEQFKAMLNEQGYSENGGIGSARDYYIGASDSLFQPIFDVYGPYDLPNDMAFYGGDDDRNAHLMVIHACEKAEAEGVDFSLYDEDDDGTIDNVFVYYAGNNEAEGAPANTVWPHRSYIPSRPQYGGKALYDYACSSELRGRASTTMCGIGTFCHEFSHVLGLADLYDIDYTKNTVGAWDIMASGSYNGDGCQPPSYSAFERFSVGWLTPTVLTDAGQYLLEPLTTHNQAYLIPVSDNIIEPNTNAEYFLLENRQEVGWEAGNSCLVGTGMLVWHIDYKASAWAQNRPNSGKNLLCFIESATGNKMTIGTSSDPFPGARQKTMFQPSAVDGTLLERPLLDIRQIDKTITFVYIQDANKHLTFGDIELITLDGSYTALPEGENDYEIPVKTITLSGKSLDPSRVVTVQSSSRRFKLRAGEEEALQSIEVTPNSDSTLNVSIEISYAPGKQVCDYESANVQAQQGAAWAILELQGKAPRKTLVTEPQPAEYLQLTPYSAELTWKAVPDATHYYLSLYQLQDGATELEQGFENFDSSSAVAMAGWETNFNTISSLLKEAGSYSLHFQKEGDYAISEKYLQPVSSIRFWYGAPTSEIDTVGLLTITATDGKTAEVIDEIMIRKRDRKKVYEKAFNTPQYIQFTLTFTPANEQSQGVCIDNFTAYCDKQITPIYQNEDLTIEATDGEDFVTCYVGGLKPQTEYFYKIRVSDKDRGGCVENIKEMEKAVAFTTLAGKNGEQDLGYGIENINTSNPLHVIYIPENQPNATLYFYDIYGHLITSIPVAEGQLRVEFPEGNFVRGNIYIVKYSVTDKVKRKDRYAKIIY